MTEAEVKSAFLLKFILFVDWPPDAFSDGNSPYVIGIAGDSPIQAALQAMVSGKTINGRPLTVRGGHEFSQTGALHLLFLPASERKRAAPLLLSLKSAPVLTVGESDEFARIGGILNFYIEDDRVRFEANPDAAQHAGLKIRAQLLSLARIVRNP